jgi:RimJ/RimL family protein N-acetyltransferase
VQNATEANPTKLLIEEAMHSWQCGDSYRAAELLERGMLTDPYDRDLYAAYLPIAEWRDSLRSSGFPLVAEAEAGPCLLEPMGPQHAAGFLAVYDHEIARLCCMPRLESLCEWHAWLDQQRSFQDQITLAILIPGIGAVGMLCLVVHGNTGFVFYWLGQRYRGKGIVTQAVGVLLQQACSQWGVNTFYAKAYQDNLASHAVLKRLGFEALPFHGKAPHVDEIFFRLGSGLASEEVAIELDRFMRAIGSECRPWFLLLGDGASGFTAYRADPSGQSGEEMRHAG